MDARPNFMELARLSIEMFHQEVLDFPQDIIDKAIEYKALQLEKSYNEMLQSRR